MNKPVGKMYTQLERREIAQHVKNACKDNGLQPRYVYAYGTKDEATWSCYIIGQRRLNSDFKIDYKLLFYFDTRANRVQSIELEMNPTWSYLPNVVNDVFEPFRDVQQHTPHKFGSVMSQHINKTRDALDKTRAAIGYVSNFNATIQSIISQLKSEATHFARKR